MSEKLFGYLPIALTRSHGCPALNSDLFVGLRSGPPILGSAIERGRPLDPSSAHAPAVEEEFKPRIGKEGPPDVRVQVRPDASHDDEERGHGGLTLGPGRPVGVAGATTRHGPSACAELVGDFRLRAALGAPPIAPDRADPFPPLDAPAVEHDLDAWVFGDQPLHVLVESWLVPGHDQEGAAFSYYGRRQ